MPSCRWPSSGLKGSDRTALLKETLRVVLLSLGLALTFAAAAERRGSPLSQRGEWRLAVERVLEAGLSRRAETLGRREEVLQQQREFNEQEALRARHSEDQQEPVRPPADSLAGIDRVQGRLRRGAVDVDYFESIAGNEDEPPAEPNTTSGRRRN